MQDKMLLGPSINHITVVDEGICEELVSLGIPQKKVSYVPNGVNTRQFQPHETNYLKEELGVPDDHMTLLSLGRMSPQKEPKKLVEVFDRLTNIEDSISLIMSGSGELLPEIKEQVRNLNLDNVYLPGFVPEERKANMYAGSDFFIMSSAYEGQPLALFEAMASGLPCIVPDLPNLELVEEANCGCLVDFESSNIANKIHNYISEDRTLEGENARKYATNELSWEGISKQYLQIMAEETDD
jgi:glycosyltransferase involved in cell wall biosynthesis